MSQLSNNDGTQHKKSKEKSKKGDKSGARSNRMIDADEVEDRFYEFAEYNRFTPEAKTKLYNLRENNRERNRSNKKRKVSFSNSSATHSSWRDDDGNSSDDQSAATPPRNNKSNRALTRQRNHRS